MNSAPAPTAAPPAPSLRSMAIRAVLWTLGGDGASQVARFLANLLLTRLLIPDHFGLMVIVNFAMQGLQMFSDVGLRPSVIRSPRGNDPVFLNTAWTVQVIRGVMLWIASCLLAWPLARYYGYPALAQLLPVVGLYAILAGFASTKLLTCDRNLTLGQATCINLGTFLLGAGVMVVWARISPSVWALVSGGIVSNLARTLLTHWILPGPNNRFQWDRDSWRELSKYGRWVFVSTMATFLATQTDRLIFAKLIPLALLGVYNIAIMCTRTPADMVLKLISAVGLPTFSRALQRDGTIDSVFRRTSLGLLAAGGAGLGFLILVGPAAIRMLYDNRYQEAGWMVQIIALGVWFQVMEGMNTAALLALSEPKWVAAANLTKVVGILVVLPLAYRLYGFGGALVGMALVDVPRYLIVAARTRARKVGGWATELSITACVLLTAAAAHVLRAEGHARSLFLAGLLFLAIWTVPAWIVVRRLRAAAPVAEAG